MAAAGGRHIRPSIINRWKVSALEPLVDRRFLSPWSWVQLEISDSRGGNARHLNSSGTLPHEDLNGRTKALPKALAPTLQARQAARPCF